MSNLQYPFMDESLPLEERVSDLVQRLTLSEKIRLLPQYQAAIPRLGIAAYKHGTEAAHGISWLGNATSLPQVSGLASTWDTALLEELGSMVSTEARAFYKRDAAKNGLTLWTPTVDLGRDPRWGRNEECWGEDPILAGHSAGAYIQGLQGRDARWLKSCATLKHFLANNNEYDRGACSISLDPRNLREYYLKTFEICFREYGAQSTMTSYNAINGIPANLNPDIDGIVRGEWGFDGFIVSDAGDVFGTKREHGHAKTWSECVAWSVRAGIDSITDETGWVVVSLEDAIARKELLESDLDRAVTNVMRVRFKLGEFDSSCVWNEIPATAVDLPSHRKLALRAAEASFVLLENNPARGETKPLLPLRAEDHSEQNKLVVLGPLSEMVLRDWYSGTMPYSVSPLEGLQSRFGVEAVSAYSANPRVRICNKSDGTQLSLGSYTGSFELFDWGESSYTLRRPDTGKWLSTGDAGLHTEAEEIWGWFTREVFTINGGITSDSVTMANWNGAPLVSTAKGSLEIAESLPETQGPIGIAALHKAETAGQEASPLVFVDEEKARDLALDAAKNAKTAIVCIGNHPLVNAKETIDRKGVNVAQSQEALVRDVLAVNPRTIVVIFGSYPLASEWIAKNAPVVLHVAHPGQECGNALAAILSGDRNPSGRLPTGWLRDTSSLPDLLDYDIIRGKRSYQYSDAPVLWPFGHGLSYTNFEWSNLKLNTDKNVIYRAEVLVKNVGSCRGADIVQLYLSAQNSAFARPLRQLVNFGRVELEPGESEVLSLEIPHRSFELWHPVLERWYTESICWRLSASSSALVCRLSVDFKVQGETLPQIDISLRTKAKAFSTGNNLVIDFNSEDYSAACIRVRRNDERTTKVDMPLQASLGFEHIDATKPFRSLHVRIKGNGRIRFFDTLDCKNKAFWCIDTVGYLDADNWRSLSCGFAPRTLSELGIQLEGSIYLAYFQFR